MRERLIKEKYSHHHFEKDGNAQCYAYAKGRDMFFFKPFNDDAAGCIFQIEKFAKSEKDRSYSFPTYAYFPANGTVFFYLNDHVEPVAINDMEKFQMVAKKLMNDSYNKYDFKLLSFEEVHVLFTLNGGHLPFKDEEYSNVLDSEKIEKIELKLAEATSDNDKQDNDSLSDSYQSEECSNSL